MLPIEPSLFSSTPAVTMVRLLAVKLLLLMPVSPVASLMFTVMSPRLAPVKLESAMPFPAPDTLTVMPAISPVLLASRLASKLLRAIALPTELTVTRPMPL